MCVSVSWSLCAQQLQFREHKQVTNANAATTGTALRCAITHAPLLCRACTSPAPSPSTHPITSRSAGGYDCRHSGSAPTPSERMLTRAAKRAEAAR